MAEIREDALLNGRQCAESLGISRTAFNNWKITPTSEKGRQKLYSVKDVLRVYRERCRRELKAELREEIRAELVEAGQDDSSIQTPAEVKLALDRERVRLTQAQADGQELKNEIARHEVAPFDFLTFLLGRTANEIAGVMDALPVELMRKLNLTPKEVEKVKGVTALAADSIVNLGDEAFIGEALDEFIAQTD
jgi:phage terminase Nu1 subunit (DNA packaging protein)